MTCPTCRAYVPDTVLACPYCVEMQSRAAMRQFQLRPLRLIAAGEGLLTTRTIAHGAPSNTLRHVQMIGAMRTFCDLTVEPHHRRGSIELDDLMRSETVCAKCREEVSVLCAQAAEAV